MHRPILFFDFDNTVTLQDVLDKVIERYSTSDAWRVWERAWQAGRMSTADCLRLQIGDVRASPEELRQFVSQMDIDPAFRRIVAWAHFQGIGLGIVSDNFAPLIGAILDHHRLPPITVLANELDFVDDRLAPRFPFHDPDCSRCAHCKAQHLRAVTARPRIFVGDGLSDVCPAQVADVVFAKDSLARELERRGVPFHGYRTLDEVLRYLQEHHSAPRSGSTARATTAV
jgi:2,3-diketo-5-methylthio-1-phosphopentane phosphatase